MKIIYISIMSGLAVLSFQTQAISLGNVSTASSTLTVSAAATPLSLQWTKPPSIVADHDLTDTVVGQLTISHFDPQVHSFRITASGEQSMSSSFTDTAGQHTAEVAGKDWRVNGQPWEIMPQALTDGNLQTVNATDTVDIRFTFLDPAVDPGEYTGSFEVQQDYN